MSALWFRTFFKICDCRLETERLSFPEAIVDASALRVDRKRFLRLLEVLRALVFLGMLPWGVCTRKKNQ